MMFYKILKWKKWTSIEDCPSSVFKARIIYKNGNIAYKKVYVHTDNNFLMWKNIRLKDNSNTKTFKVTHYRKLITLFC